MAEIIADYPHPNPNFPATPRRSLMIWPAIVFVVGLVLFLTGAPHVNQLTEQRLWLDQVWLAFRLCGALFAFVSITALVREWNWRYGRIVPAMVVGPHSGLTVEDAAFSLLRPSRVLGIAMRVTTDRYQLVYALSGRIKTVDNVTLPRGMMLQEGDLVWLVIPTTFSPAILLTEADKRAAGVAPPSKADKEWLMQTLARAKQLAEKSKRR